ENNSVTHDRGRWEVQQSLLRRNPALALSAPTWGWIVASLDVTARFKAPGALDGVQCPVLTASAGEEKLVDNASHEIVCAALPKSTHITVEGAYHEILMETDDKRDQFWTAFDALLDKAGV
ncbi:MAG: alpha/beta hydrolase, partial [Pseudomonadota bacterium]